MTCLTSWDSDARLLPSTRVSLKGCKNGTRAVEKILKNSNASPAACSPESLWTPFTATTNVSVHGRVGETATSNQIGCSFTK